MPRRIVSFVLPLGYSFNLDGSMMYCTFASLFIAQAYGIHLTLGQQITMLALLMITSKGIAGVPRASLVVIAATLPVFHLPEAGLLLILGVDHLLDMGRSATNVVGNSVAAVIVSKWEKQLRVGPRPPKPPTAVRLSGRLIAARRRRRMSNGLAAGMSRQRKVNITCGPDTDLGLRWRRRLHLLLAHRPRIAARQPPRPGKSPAIAMARRKQSSKKV